MKLIATGGRSYHLGPVDKLNLASWICHLQVDQILVGDSLGADKEVREWAEEKEIPVEVFRADWGKHKLAAKQVCNRKILMAADPARDVVLAFPGDHNTDDMIRQAKARGFQVVEIDATCPF